MSTRLDIAISFLKEGKSFLVGDIRLSTERRGFLEVIGWSHSINMNNITREKCIKELAEIKEIFFRMIKSSYELEVLSINNTIVYILCFNDSGKGSIEICSEIENKTEFKLDL